MKEEKAYTELRRLCRTRRISTADLAEIIGKSPGYCCKRFRGAADWTTDDMALIARALGLRPIDLPILFPLHGKYAGTYYDALPASDQLAETIKTMIMDAVKDEIGRRTTNRTTVMEVVR